MDESKRSLESASTNEDPHTVDFSDSDGLTIKQRIFIENYLIYFNGTKAAKIAGYGSPMVAASQLLRNVKVTRYIDARYAEYKLSANEVLGRLTSIARADIGDYVTIGIDGKAYMHDEKTLADLNTNVIKKFSKYKGETVIELHDPVKALELLGKHYRLFADVQITGDKGDGTADTMSDAQLAAIAALHESASATGVADVLKSAQEALAAGDPWQSVKIVEKLVALLTQPASTLGDAGIDDSNE